MFAVANWAGNEFIVMWFDIQHVDKFFFNCIYSGIWRRVTRFFFPKARIQAHELAFGFFIFDTLQSSRDDRKTDTRGVDMGNVCVDLLSYYTDRCTYIKFIKFYTLEH